MYVVTFYSYKGGVGRTMSLVNIAALLAKAGKRVLAVDFDLEAPGLSSYAPFACAEGLPGVVDYVEEYRRNLRAPKVEDFIVRCDFHGDPIWVLPAGASTSPGYTDRLNEIDWAALYEHEGGFEMFEDLRNQWEKFEGKGFDYVLLDSRTGHTDVGGICTRQLPDAVIVLFVPNKQNVAGLAPIVSGIRNAERPNGQAIKLHLCPSNVPDLFDEDDVLGRTLKMADQYLGLNNRSLPGPENTIIHHRNDLEILEDPILVHSRPNSKLAREYGELREALVSLNPEDRQGAIINLSRLPAFYRRELKQRGGRAVLEISRQVGEVLVHHPRDGEISMLAAEAYQLIGEIELELQSLSTAIETGYMPTRARLLRSVAAISLDKRAEALEDLRLVLTSPDGTNFEFHPAVQLLRSFGSQAIPTARELFSEDTTRLRAKLQLAPLLTQGGGDFDLVSDTLRKEFDRLQDNEDARRDAGNAAMLALLAAGRPAEALEIASEVPNPHAALRFNSTMARWMLTGILPAAEFGKIASEIKGMNSRDANTLQCLALALAGTGQVKEADETLRIAARSVVPSSLVFSCWTYHHGSSQQFRKDIREMRSELEKTGRLVPPVVSAFEAVQLH